MVEFFMLVAIDRVGRLVIPKSLRTALGIEPDTMLEVLVDGAGLRLEPLRRSERPIEEVDGLPLLGYVEGARLGEQDILRLRDELQQ